MKIHIITIFDSGNYGNRLQNYALTFLLKRYGNVSTLNYRLYDPLLKTIKTFLFFPLRRNKFHHSFKKKNAFNLFNKHIRFINRYSDCKDNNCLFILGSDQIWNYHWFSNSELLTFLGAKTNAKTISYAASFGVSEVDDDVKPIFQRYLPRLKAISVREDRGAELVKEMTGLDATVVLDPTLMLTTTQWNTITRGFVPDDDRYVLTYFLGKPSDEQEKTIQSYAKAHGCRVRRILDLRDKETYVAGPQDFVELFSKAQYVFTDSYHACCFSILYHKQFTVFNRAGMEGKANMNSRMETLFRLFDLDSVVMDKGLAPRIDYDKVDKLLAQHRAESQAWLDKAMEA